MRNGGHVLTSVVRVGCLAALLVGAFGGHGCGASAPRPPIIGVSMAHFDDNWLTILRTGMTEYAATLPGVALQFSDAQGDVARQLNHIQNFVAQGAVALIVNAADTAATPSMTKVAREAGVPLVYVNRRPAEAALP